MRLSVDRPVDRPLFSVDRPGRPGQTESWLMSVSQPLDRPFLCHGRLGGRLGHVCACCAYRSTDLVHRSIGRSTGICIGLLHALFLFPLTSGLCVIFLYLLYLLSLYKSMILCEPKVNTHNLRLTRLTKYFPLIHI